MELFNAVNNNDLFYLQEVIMEDDDLDINQSVIGSMTALHVAAEKGHTSCVQVLLSAGADRDAQDEHGCTALMNGISAGYPLVVMKLLHARSDPNVSDRRHMTAIHLACRGGSAGVTQLLLAAGARTDVWNDDGESPLNLAVKGLHTDSVTALLLGCAHQDTNSLAADLRCPNPLFYALKRNKFCLARALVLAGYRSSLELFLYVTLRNTASELSTTYNLNDAERISQMYFSRGSVLPLALQDCCRLTIRKHLANNIWDKVHLLNLPTAMLDFVCFREVYSPPNLSSESHAYSFFNDHAREIYELI